MIVTFDNLTQLQATKRSVGTELRRLQSQIDGFDPLSSDVARLAPEIDWLNTLYNRLSDAEAGFAND